MKNYCYVHALFGCSVIATRTHQVLIPCNNNEDYCAPFHIFLCKKCFHLGPYIVPEKMHKLMEVCLNKGGGHG